MRGARPGYLAYLLRLWCVGEGDSGVWRASLHDVRTGERVGFSGLEEAFAFLQQQVEASPGEMILPRERDPGAEWEAQVRVTRAQLAAEEEEGCM